ncbi:glyoxalase [Actinorhabdospora filicis]|uniref:Glyoxalase n=1 Tax=Actinorhabdospora filicis TaxID=1785913 RepID=A0A9W6W8E2_9ACTN|nr:VOC family protein [Actinorhabdospora filicis]GLZ76883.1 glyoxalase [Actinorhabdospora filicis]
MRLNAIEILTVDMPASLAFYRLLGLDIPAEMDAEGHVECDFGAFKLMWDTVESVRSFLPGVQVVPGGRMSLAFQCDTAEEVDAAYERVTAAGAKCHLEPFDAVWGQRYAAVSDPDGNGVDFYARLS